MIVPDRAAARIRTRVVPLRRGGTSQGIGDDPVKHHRDRRRLQRPDHRRGGGDRAREIVVVAAHPDRQRKLNDYVLRQSLTGLCVGGSSGGSGLLDAAELRAQQKVVADSAKRGKTRLIAMSECPTCAIRSDWQSRRNT
jgi:hypothetical protein